MKLILFLFLNLFLLIIEAQDCEHIDDIENGKITYNPYNEIGLSSGTTATLRCLASDFETTSRCENGKWTPESLGQCPEPRQDDTETDENGLKPQSVKRQEPDLTNENNLSSYCQSLASPPNSFLSYSPVMFPPYPSGTIATLNCFLGHSPVGKTGSICENGQWTDVGTCQMVTSQKCSPMMNVPNGIINYISAGSGPYDFGSVAKLTCSLGHSVSGNSQVSCESGGWSPSPGLGQCQEVSNTTAVVPRNSNSRVKRQFGLGTTSGINCSPLTVFGGTVNYIQSNPSAPYSSGTTAMLVCNLGYTPSGSSSSFCSNGMWNPPLGMCQQGGSSIGVGHLGGLGTTPIGGLGLGTGGQCSPIGTLVMNGQITYSTGTSSFGPYPSGTMATVTCNPGFLVSGSHSATCMNGMWNPSILGSCTNSGFGTTPGFGSTPGLAGHGAQCLGMLSPLGGSVQYSQQMQGFGTYNQGTQATLLCNPGMTPSGSTSSSCFNGQWNPPTLGSCTGTSGGFGSTPGFGTTGLNCPAMASPLNAQINYSQAPQGLNTYNEGTSATLVCFGGFVSGSSTSFCRNGMWSPTIGICQGGTTGWNNPGGIAGGTGSCAHEMPSVINGHINYSSGSSYGPFPSGTTATLICNSGLPQGQSTAFCQNGMWTPPMFGGCSGFGSTIGGFGTTPGGFGLPGGGQCFGLLAPFNGQIQYSQGGTFGPFPSGTTATLMCNSGHTVSGAQTASCINGHFNPPLGQCIQGSSGFGTGFGGQYISRSITSNKEITDNSLHSSTSPSESGSSNIIDECKTNSLPLVSNGRLEYTGNPNVAEVVCNTGYTSHVSQITVFCQNGKIQTKEIASCIPSSPVFRQPKNGNEADCGYPVVHVERGQIIYSSGSNYAPFSPGTVATLICEFGNQPIGGSTTSTCINGSWSQEMASCSAPGRSPRGQCDLLPRISGGNIAYSEIFNTNGPFNEGTFATLMCDFGRTLTGNPTTTCHDSLWKPDLGSCLNPNNLTDNFNSHTGTPMKHPVNIRCPPIKSTSLKSTLEFTQTPLSDGNYPNSTVVRLICLENGALVSKGVGQARCMNGDWVPSLGECDTVSEQTTDSTKFAGPGICQPIKTPEKGKITYIQSGKKSYEFGTTAILNCDLGYSVSGHAALSCGPRGEWLPLTGFGKCVSNVDLVH